MSVDRKPDKVPQGENVRQGSKNGIGEGGWLTGGWGENGSAI